MSKLDELMALVELFADSAGADIEPPPQIRAALQDALKAVVEDAERYRWLRDRMRLDDPDAWDIFMGSSISEWDTCIDAARKP